VEEQMEKTGPLPRQRAAPAPPAAAPSSPQALLRLGWRAISRLVNGLFAHNAFETAASIAFWFFLSLVPLLVFIGWLLGRLVRAQGIDALLQPALEVAPISAEQLLRTELGRMAQSNSAPLAPVSVLGFLWTSSSGLHNLMDIIEIAVKVPRRPWWKQRAIALAWVFLGLLTVAGLGWGLVRVELSLHSSLEVPALVSSADAPAPPADQAASARPPRPGRDPAAVPPPRAPPVRGRIRQRVAGLLQGPWEKALAALATLAVGITFLAAFYRFAVEHPTGVRRHAFPGAFAAAVSWLGLSWGFGTYVSSLGNYAVYYGSVAAVAVLLIWLYLTSLTLVIGAEVNAQLEGIRE
jgi:uncharacterized BrkB/YihY/UPF0761 family membrane protein